MSYLITIEPEHGGKGYRWSVTRNAQPSNNLGGYELTDPRAWEHGMSGLTVKKGEGLASTRDEAELQARLACQLDTVSRRLAASSRESLADLKERVYVTQDEIDATLPLPDLEPA